MDEFNALIFAADQETDHLKVYQGNFAQVQNFTLTAINHCRLNVAYMARLNPASQSQSGHASIGIFFNLKHLVPTFQLNKPIHRFSYPTLVHSELLQDK